MEEHGFLLKLLVRIIISIALLAFVTGLITQITDDTTFVMVLPILFIGIAFVLSFIMV